MSVQSPEAQENESARLMRLLERERDRAAGLQSELDGVRRDLDRSQEDGRTLFRANKALLRRLRWHWTNYPGTEQDWERRGQGADVFELRRQALRARLVQLIAEPEFGSEDRRVTAVITSCDRHDLLERTLASLFRTNTYPLEKVIVVEDGEREASDEIKGRFRDQPMEWINTGGRAGQIRAIDAAYARVGTPYIFHVEDDYDFLRPGYIDQSLRVLEGEPLCLQVWLRGAPGPESHPFEDRDCWSGKVCWRRVAADQKQVWHGFSFNPGLRRMREYRLIGSSYAAIAEARLGKAGIGEAQLSELYASIGYFAAALWLEGGQAYALHRGNGRHVK
jgi:hypothetical protein